MIRFALIAASTLGFFLTAALGNLMVPLLRAFQGRWDEPKARQTPGQEAPEEEPEADSEGSAEEPAEAPEEDAEHEPEEEPAEEQEPLPEEEDVTDCRFSPTPRRSL